MKGQKEERGMSRRGENIRKRTDGRWEARFPVTDYGTGQRKCKSVYAKTYADVKAKLAEAKCMFEKEAQKAQKEVSDSQSNHLSKSVHPPASAAGENIPLTKPASEWLSEVSRLKKHSTYIKYKGIYNKHLSMKLNGILITDMVGNKAEELYGQICFPNENLSGSLTRSISCVFNQILNYCNIHYNTDIRPVNRPKIHMTAKPVETLPQSEQIQLLREIYKNMDHNKLGILLCLSTGLRLGEICSLKWSDIDLDGKLLYVNRTVQRIAVDAHSTKTILFEDVPKSLFSKREIPLPDNIIPYLAAFMCQDGYVISGKGPTEPRTYQYRFQRLLSEAGVGKHNFHAIRHTFATNCINSGADVKSLSEILGHSNVNITLNRYVHPTIDTKRKHLNNLSSVYSQYVEQKNP